MPIRIEAGEYCSSEEAAEMTGSRLWTIQKMLRDGEIPGAVRFSERCWLIPLASAEGLPKRERGRPRKDKAAE